jgi:hypothetical protein
MSFHQYHPEHKALQPCVFFDLYHPMPYAVAGRTRGLFATFRLAGLAAEATDLSIRLVYLTNQAQNEQVALFSGIAML